MLHIWLNGQLFMSNLALLCFGSNVQITCKLLFSQSELSIQDFRQIFSDKGLIVMLYATRPGGGGHSVCIAWQVCAAGETPICKPKFRCGAHNFHEANIFRSRASPFLVARHIFCLVFAIFAIPETIVFNISFRSSHYQLHLQFIASKSASQTSIHLCVQ